MKGFTAKVVLANCLVLSLLVWVIMYHQSEWKFQMLSAIKHPPNSRSNVAIVSFLSTRPDDSNKDDYFNATRVLAYKLLHDPDTKTQKNIPFLVAVTETVEEWKRDQLKNDGAHIIEVEYIPAEQEMIKGEQRWIDQYTKLRIWQLTMFDRMLYIDSDMLIVYCLDGVFDDPASFPIPITDSESDLPDTYLLAGSDDVHGANNPIPRPESPNFNAGFFVFQPSLKMFRKYVQLMSHPEKYQSNVMEQGLLNYAHHQKGAMPWKRLTPGKWNVNWPNYNDYEYGVASLHDKWWRKGADPELTAMWYKDLSKLDRREMYV